MFAVLVVVGAIGSATAHRKATSESDSAVETTVAAPPSSASSSTTKTQQATASTQLATAYWRVQVAAHYHDPVATDDGRGCARAGEDRFVCTAYVRNPNRDIDVFGSVVVTDGAMTVRAHLNRGNEITKWFQQTGGGCGTPSCKGTHLG